MVILKDLRREQAAGRTLLPLLEELKSSQQAQAEQFEADNLDKLGKIEQGLRELERVTERNQASQMLGILNTLTDRVLELESRFNALLPSRPCGPRPRSQATLTILPGGRHVSN